MLLNISNHPWKKWSDSQKDAAHQHFGMVEDLIFPDIDPGLALEDVKEIAADYLNFIHKKKETAEGESNFAVLLAGEYTLVFQLLLLLREDGIPAYTATSKRDVSYKPDGVKIINFEFVSFRRYY